MAVLTGELWAYSTHTSKEDQEAGSREVVLSQDQGCLKILVLPLRLPVRLGMKTRQKARGGAQQLAELPPINRRKLRPPIRQYVQGKTVEPKHTLHQQLSSVLG